MLQLRQYHDVVFAVVFCALGAGGVEKIRLFGCFALSADVIGHFFCPNAGVFIRTFENLSIYDLLFCK